MDKNVYNLDFLLMCGGYNKDDGYRTSCEGMARGAGIQQQGLKI